MRYLIEKTYKDNNMKHLTMEEKNSIDEIFIEEDLERVVVRSESGNRYNVYYIGRRCTEDEIKNNEFEIGDDVKMENDITKARVKFIKLARSGRYIVVDENSRVINEKKIINNKYTGDVNLIMQPMEKIKRPNDLFSVDRYYADLNYACSEIAENDLSIYRVKLDSELEAVSIPKRKCDKVKKTTYYVGRKCTENEVNSNLFTVNKKFSLNGLTYCNVQFIKTKKGNYYIIPDHDVVISPYDIDYERGSFTGFLRSEICGQELDF